MHKNKLKKLLVFLIFLLISVSLFGINEKQLFQRMKQKNRGYLPKSFTSIVVGKSIQKSLAKIPRKSYRGKPYVKFLYHEKYGERIIVKNVEQIYKDRFAVYLNMYKDFKFFLKKGKSYNDFNSRHVWKIMNVNSKYYVIKMRKKRNRPTDYFRLNVDRNSLLILSVIKYKNNRPTDRFYISYKRIRKYVIPSQLSFRGTINRKFRRITFYFTRIKVNVNLKESDFLN
jgi:hypothetical protein